MIRKRVFALLASAVLAFSAVGVKADTNDLTLDNYVIKDIITLERTPESDIISTLSEDKKITVSIEKDDADNYCAVMDAQYSINDWEEWTLLYIIKNDEGDFYSYQYVSDWFDPTENECNFSFDISLDSYNSLTDFTIEAFVIENFDTMKPLSTVAKLGVSRDDGHTTESNIKYIKSFSNSYNPENSLLFSTEGNKLSISGKMSDENKKWIWSFLSPIQGNIKTKYAQSINENDGTYSSSADLSELSDGDYYLYMMSSTEHYSTYTSFITGTVKVYVKNSEAFFALPEDIYNNNINLSKNEKNSPEYFVNQKYPSNTTIWVHQDDETIEKKALEITKGCNTEYEKIKAIHDWVSDNIYYNYDYYYGYTKENPVTDLDTLKNGYSVCHGYANLFASLCRSLSIPCRIVTGYGLHSGSDWGSVTDGENHAWDEAYIEDENRWVIVDCTWDSSNKLLNGKFEKGDVSETYFDITDELFSFDHRADSYYNK
jgi:hypothetical protein